MTIAQVIDIASSKFVNSLDTDDKNRMKRELMWSCYEQDEFLLKECKNANISIELFYDTENHENFLKTILSKLTNQGVQYNLADCYKYLVA
jgi:hypothetical protein